MSTPKPRKATRGTKSPVKAKQKAVKPAVKASSKLKLPVSSGLQPWRWHGILDLSLENQPVLRNFGQGEREMEFMLQAHHAVLAQGAGSQLTLRLRVQINLKDGPLVLAEMHYAGIVEIPLLPEQITTYQAVLYPFARETMLGAFALVGQAPPLPTEVTELNQE